MSKHSWNRSTDNLQSGMKFSTAVQAKPKPVQVTVSRKRFASSCSAITYQGLAVGFTALSFFVGLTVTLFWFWF